MENMEQRMFLSGGVFGSGFGGMHLHSVSVHEAYIAPSTGQFAVPAIGGMEARHPTAVSDAMPYWGAPAVGSAFGGFMQFISVVPIMRIGFDFAGGENSTPTVDTPAQSQNRPDVRHTPEREVHHNSDVDPSAVANFIRTGGQRIVRSVQSDADASDSTSAAASTLAAAAPVNNASAAGKVVNAAAKSIFATDQTIGDAAQVHVAAPKMNPIVAAMPNNAAPARTLAAYLSTLTQNAAPMLANANMVAAAKALVNAGAAAEEAITAAAQALPITQRFEIAHLGSPFMLLGDSIGAFIEESAGINAVATPEQMITRPYRAWMVTFAVITIDAALLTYYQKRRKASARPAL